MRIDTGNFGQTSAQLNPIQVNRGNAGIIGEAHQQAARMNESAQGQLAQAGQGVTQLGENIHNSLAELDRLKASAALTDRQTAGRGVLDGLQDDVAAGKVKAADVEKEFQTRFKAAWTDPEFSDLSHSGQIGYQKGRASTDMQFSSEVDHLRRGAVRVETKGAVDTILANTSRMAIQPDADVNTINAGYDALDAQGQVAYGADWAKVKENARADNWKMNVSAAINSSRDSNEHLNAIANAISDPNGALFGKLDAQDQLQVMNQIQARTEHNDAKAIAAENQRMHAEEMAQRRADAANTKAGNLYNSYMEARFKGIPLSPELIEQAGQQFKGTSYAGKEKDLAMMDRQLTGFSNLPFTDQALVISNKETAQNVHGATSLEEAQLLDMQRQTYQKSRAEFNARPLEQTAQRMGIGIGALDTSLLTQGGTLEQHQTAVTQFQQQLADRIMLRDQAKKLDPSVKVSVFTTEEAAQSKAYLADPKIPAAEKLKFVRDIQRGAGDHAEDVMSGLGLDSMTRSAAYHADVSPSDKTADLIMQGRDMLHPVTGTAAPHPSNTDLYKTAVSYYGNTMSPAQIQQALPTALAHYVATQGTNLSTKIDQSAFESSLATTVGKPVQIGAMSLVAPDKMGAPELETMIHNGLPGGQLGTTIYNNLQNGGYILKPLTANSYAIMTADGLHPVGDASKKPVVLRLN